MANQVFANGMEIACKAGAGKVMAAFPDVCMTPPENPATPPGVPVPYPNTAMASDTTDGSKKVKISDEEIMLKNKSCFKKSTGDEAGSAAKKGVISSKNTGKVYFIKWSMDVKIEGENVDRHLDMTTNNHGSPTANEAVPWPYIDTQTMAEGSKCAGDKEKKDAACSEHEPCPGVLSMNVDDLKAQVEKQPANRIEPAKSALGNYEHPGGARGPKAAETAGEAANECVKRSRCHLRPYNAEKSPTGSPGCCPGQTAHHIPPKSCFEGKGSYNDGKALCVCLEGSNQFNGSHGKNHAALDYLTVKEFPGSLIASGANAGQVDSSKIGKIKTKRYIQLAAAATAAQTGCDPDCLEAQLLDSFERDHKIDENTEVDPYISLKGTKEAGVPAPMSAQQYQQSMLGNMMSKLDEALARLGQLASNVR